MTDPKVIVLDTETTGVDTSKDRIVELCIMDYGKPETATVWRFNPEMPISDEARSVHGISDADVASEPRFLEAFPEPLKRISDADVIVGYNVKFDVSMLEAAFDRIGVPSVMEGKVLVDPFLLWKQKEPRDLSSAFRRFVGDELSNAHAAEVDTMAAADALLGMIEHWGLEGLSWHQLARECDPKLDTYVGFTNHFVWKDGVAVFGFGKHKGKPLHQNRGYLSWMLKSTFPESVKAIATRVLNGETLRKE